MSLWTGNSETQELRARVEELEAQLPGVQETPHSALNNALQLCGALRRDLQERSDNPGNNALVLTVLSSITAQITEAQRLLDRISL